VLVGGLFLLAWALSTPIFAQESPDPVKPFELQTTEPLDAWMALGSFPLTESEQTSPALPTDLLTEKGVFRPTCFSGAKPSHTPGSLPSPARMVISIASSNRAGSLLVSEEQRQAVYLYRTLLAPERMVRVLALSLPGSARVWLNGQPIEPGSTSTTASVAPSFWSPPDRIIFWRSCNCKKGPTIC
jgi:hypothetical protein